MQLDEGDETTRGVSHAPGLWVRVPDDTIELELVLTEGPDPTITATYQDHTVVYYPTTEPFGCD